MEKLGNKKSAGVVAALNEYLEQHPEAKSETLRIRVEQESSLRKEKLEQFIRSLVREQIEKANISADRRLSEPKEEQQLEDDIAQMLENLDLFQ